MQGNTKTSKFPDPFAPKEEKDTVGYGLQYAKAIEAQWGEFDHTDSLYRKRQSVFDRCRSYANGTQSTTIYRKLLTSLDPSNSDGSLLNLDFTPVPIIPKFVKIVVNKILSKRPRPNVEAIDPLSSSEKDRMRKRTEILIENKDQIMALREGAGVKVAEGEEIPDTKEEAEIFVGTNIKTQAEIAAQIGVDITLRWNNFSDNTYRRCLDDLVTLGMAVTKRSNDPSYGIKEDYVDPNRFIHSYTEDPNMDDLVYAGSMRTVSIQELKRMAGDDLTEEQYKEVAKFAKDRKGNDSSKFTQSYYDQYMNRNVYGYDEYMIDVMDFEFICTEEMHFEEKETKYGNKGFYYKGSEYKQPKNSVYERTPHKLQIGVLYGGVKIVGMDMLFSYGKKTNVPKNIYDISRVKLSYSAVCTNLYKMMPKSMVDNVIGFADLIQITHLKLQQSIAKAKPDGIVIDIEGLENVQLGKGGELQPLDLHDIYEQTGVFYYRSKNPEGGFENPPVRPIDNRIRNINELITLYNHYLNMIRDATGINEMMDGTTPKGETLVGVQQNAIAAGNNAIYDVTNASMILFKKVVEDIVKCLQILPQESVIYNTYKNAIGDENMKVLNSFSNLPMYNFGVVVVKDMDEQDRVYLEQNIQVALAQKEIDIEDAIAIRNLHDVDQAERLLVVRRKKRIKQQQEIAAQNSQMQAQVAAQSAQATSQAKIQELQAQFQLKMEEDKNKAILDMELQKQKYEFEMQLEQLRSQGKIDTYKEDKSFRKELEQYKEDRKDKRSEKEAVQQSKLISQRDGKRGELTEAQQLEAIQKIIE